MQRRLGDLWGGFAAMLVALPSAIAFGVAVFAPLGEEHVAAGAVYGMIGAIVLGLVAAIARGTPRLITTPCAPAAAVLAALVIEMTAGGATPSGAVFLLGVVAAVAGILQILFGALGGGRLIKYIPYPVVSGYLMGVGLLILIKQLPVFVGFPFGTALSEIFFNPSGWNAAAVTTAATTILLTMLAPRVTHRVPPVVVGVVGGIVTYVLLAVALPELRTLEGNALVIGPVSAGWDAVVAAAGSWRAFRAVTWTDVVGVLGTAGTLAVLLSIDSLKTCVILDAITHSRHDSNRELRAQGLSNLAASLVGGMPGAGAVGPTLVNVSSGAVSSLSCALVGGLSLVVYLVAGSALAWIPLPALAGILFVVGFRMIDRRTFALLRNPATYLDFAVVATVVLTALFVNLIAASAAGLALAVALFVREQVRANIIRRKVYGDQFHSKRKRMAEDLAVLERRGSQTVICELQGSLFFGTTDRLMHELTEDLKTCHTVILDMRRVQSIDFTATHLLEQISTRLGDRGGELILTELPRSLPTGRDMQAYLDDVGIGAPTSFIRILPSIEDALEWAENRIFASENLDERPSTPPLELEDFDLFSGADDDALRLFRACAVPRSVPEGGYIFHMGDSGDDIHLVRKGVVKITVSLADGRVRALASFGRRDFFGDMAFLDRETRSTDAIAKTNVELFTISRAAFDEIAERHPALTAAVFARLARALSLRLRQTNHQLRVFEEA